MSYNRRLAVQDQPSSEFAFTPDNEAWAKEQIAKYPQGREASAIIPLLWRAHEQNNNWLSRAAIEYVAALIGMPYIRALEVATFYTMFQLQPVGTKAHIQVCGTTPCMLRGANELMDVCRSRIHHEQFHRSADGVFSWEEVECAGACVNAPMIQVGKDTYEDLTPESLNKLLDGFASGNSPKPGPQNGRNYSEPQGGATTLKSGNDNTRPKNHGAELTDAEAKRPGDPANRRAEPAPHADVKQAESKGEQKGD
ncbi:MAG: NADH-quinone oxidoreductase subunit NuoE [Pseudomonadota bacterium]